MRPRPAPTKVCPKPPTRDDKPTKSYTVDKTKILELMTLYEMAIADHRRRANSVAVGGRYWSEQMKAARVLEHVVNDLKRITND